VKLASNRPCTNCLNFSAIYRQLSRLNRCGIIGWVDAQPLHNTYSQLLITRQIYSCVAVSLLPALLQQLRCLFDVTLAVLRQISIGTPAVELKHRFQASRNAINACCGVDLLHS
jgi:hypothetical protein